MAPARFTPPFCHWIVGAGLPLAATVNAAGEPAVTVWLVGWVVKAGAVAAAVTVSVTVLLVAEPAELVAMAR